MSLSVDLFSLGLEEGCSFGGRKSKQSVFNYLFLTSTHGLVLCIFFLWSNQVKDESLGINNVAEQLRDCCVYHGLVWSELRCWLVLVTHSNVERSSVVQHISRGAATTLFLAASLLLCLYSSFLRGRCMWLNSPPRTMSLCVPGQGLVPFTRNSRLLPCLCWFSCVHWTAAFADAFPCPQWPLRIAKASSDSMGYMDKSSQKCCSAWC